MNFCPRCGSRLAPRSDGGRERRACPAGGCGFVHYGDHSIGAGAVVVRGDRVLLIERRSGERAWWQIPGGFVESDEAIDRAVEREVLEETGVSASVVEVLGFRHAPSQEPERTASNIYVVFRLDAIAGEPRPDGEESFDAGFFTRAEIEGEAGPLRDVAVGRRPRLERRRRAGVGAHTRAARAPAAGTHPLRVERPLADRASPGPAGGGPGMQRQSWAGSWSPSRTRASASAWRDSAASRPCSSSGARADEAEERRPAQAQMAVSAEVAERGDSDRADQRAEAVHGDHQAEPHRARRCPGRGRRLAPSSMLARWEAEAGGARGRARGARLGCPGLAPAHCPSSREVSPVLSSGRSP